MRHGVSGNRLGRYTSWRKATIRDIAKATLIHQRICTTKAKAKEAKKLVDRLITMGKRGTLADRRRAFAILCSHQIVRELFAKTSPRFKNRPGGYTRIIPLGLRRGDNAQLSYLELTEKEEVIVSKPRSIATEKKEKLPASPHEKITAPVSEPEPRKEMKTPVSSEFTKTETQKSRPGSKEDFKLKPKKFTSKFMGGIQKFFKRKTGE